VKVAASPLTMLLPGVTVALVTQPVSRVVPEHRSMLWRGLEASATLVLVISALSLRSRLLVGIAVLAALFVLLERALPLHPRKVLRPGWRTDLVHLVANNLLSTMLLLVALITVGVALRLMVPLGWRLAVAGQPHGLQFAEAFLLASVFGYWAHRASHTVPWLWRFHRVHHSSERLDWLAAGRLHPVDQAFQRSCIVLPLFAIGFSRATFGGYLAFVTLQAIFIHANVRVRFGPLRWLIATPEFHHWHHASDPLAYNSNFAGEFPWIDLAFGTLHLPVGRMPTAYGTDEPAPERYFAQLAWPLRRPVATD
jgi:sterol desaturase/sphingolipid hydroxylase (fatty acid hydroxylase superfamily)